MAFPLFHPFAPQVYKIKGTSQRPCMAESSSQAAEPVPSDRKSDTGSHRSRSDEGDEEEESESGASSGSSRAHRSDDDQVDSTQRETRDLLPPATPFTYTDTNLPTDDVPDPAEWRHWILDRSRMVKITALCWDHKAEYGQVRQLKPSIVKYYVQRLLAQGEPIRPVNTFFKIQRGMHLPAFFFWYAEIRVTLFHCVFCP